MERRLLHNLLAGTVVLKDVSRPMLERALEDGAEGDLHMPMVADARTALKFAAAVGVVLPVLLATWPPLACDGGGSWLATEEDAAMTDMVWEALLP